jgi:hypothetical protein
MQLKVNTGNKWRIELLQGTDWDVCSHENPILYWVRIFFKGEEVTCKKFRELRYAEEYFSLAENYRYRTF